jgi:hypothetical protein
MSLLSSSILSARSIDAWAAVMLLFGEEGDERRTKFTLSEEERSAVEWSLSFSSEKK